MAFIKIVNRYSAFLYPGKRADEGRINFKKNPEPHSGSGLNLATQPCRWRDNWNAIVSSMPVLSYQGQILSNILCPRQIGTKLSHDAKI